MKTLAELCGCVMASYIFVRGLLGVLYEAINALVKDEKGA